MADAKPGPWPVSSAEYHADTQFVSHSQLEEFRRWVPTYHRRFVLGTMPRREPTEAMQLGSALHAWLLERERFADLVCVRPHFDRRTKDGKSAYAAFLEESAGKLVIDPDEMLAVQVMAVSIAENADARALLEAPDAIREQPIRWQDGQSGVWCKAKPDVWVPSLGICADVKTACDQTPEAWARQAGNLGYHRQAALYLDGIHAVTGDPASFVHIVVSTSEPYGCACYQLDGQSVELGRQQYQRSLRELAACRAVDSWRDPAEEMINVVSLPRFFFFT